MAEGGGKSDAAASDSPVLKTGGFSVKIRGRESKLSRARFCRKTSSRRTPSPEYPFPSASRGNCPSKLIVVRGRKVQGIMPCPPEAFAVVRLTRENCSLKSVVRSRIGRRHRRPGTRELFVSVCCLFADGVRARPGRASCPARRRPSPLFA